MEGINVATVMGNVVADGVLKHLPSGTAVLDFRIAVGSRRPAKDNEKGIDNGEHARWTDHVEYIEVKSWGKRAEYISQYVIKGAPVCATGSIATRSWEGKDGQRRYRTFVNAETVVVLPRMPRQPGAGYSQREMPAEHQAEPGENDIPW